MSDKASYKSIRDQLVSISVDIDDKGKICKILEKKIESERLLLSRVESTLSEEYENKIQVIINLFALLLTYPFWFLIADNIIRMKLRNTLQTQVA